MSQFCAKVGEAVKSFAQEHFLRYGWRLAGGDPAHFAWLATDVTLPGPVRPVGMGEFGGGAKVRVELWVTIEAAGVADATSAMGSVKTGSILTVDLAEISDRAVSASIGSAAVSASVAVAIVSVAAEAVVASAATVADRAAAVVAVAAVSAACRHRSSAPARARSSSSTDR